MEFTTEEPAHGPYDTVETVDETTINVGLSSDSEYGNTAADVYDSTGIIQESLDDSIVFQTTTEVACENEKADIDPAREMAHIKRRFVLEKVGHCNDETGVNVERAKRFIEAIGLHVEDSAHLIVKGDDIGMVTDTVVSVCNKPKTEDDVFDYIDELQLNIIWRPKMCPSSIEEEVVYGRVIASAAVQNELPPGSFEGKFLEVGFRRWVSRTYAHVTRLHQTRPIRHYTMPLYPEMKDPPEKYYHARASSYTAMTWDVLFNAHPGLVEQVIAQRGKDNHFKSIADILNAAHPGLYNELHSAPWTMTKYDGHLAHTTLERVMEAYGVSWDDMNRICEDGRGAQYINEKIAAYEQEHDFPLHVETSDIPDLDPYVGITSTLDIPPATERVKMSEAEDIAAAKRALLFEKIGHVNDETGVDMARVDRFLSSLGLTAAPHHLIINGRDEETVIKEMRAVGIKAASLKGLCGRYYSQLDLPLVRRDNLFEAQTETILFHEKVHSSRGGASAN